MPLLNTADKVYVGTTLADAVYLGTDKVWPPVTAGGWGPSEGIYLSSTTPAVNGSYPNSFASGNDIQALVNGRITGLRYWHIAGTPTSRLVSLWSNSGSLLARVNHTGAVDGWNTVSITPIVVAAGTEYRVCIGQSGSGAGDGWPYTNSSYTSVSPHLTWMAGVYSVDTPEGGEDDFPDTITGIYHYFTDLVFQAQLVPAFSPADIAGLTIWLDASQTASANPWHNLGSGTNPSVVGTPDPVLAPNALNGLPVIQLSTGAGRYRFSGTGVTANYTLVYVGRMRGPYPVGRVITAVYSEGGNLLYGFWQGYQDVAFAGGFFVPDTRAGFSPPSDWKLYSGDADPTNARLFSNGVLLGQYPPTEGFGNYFAISGYHLTADAETCDCDVAEVLLYNRKLTDAERVQVEGYLRSKWGLT